MSQTPSSTTPNKSGSREAILSAIRRAISVPAPRPGHHAGEAEPQKETAHTSGPPAPALQFQSTLPIVGQEQAERRAWLPPVGETWNDWANLFAANSHDLRSEFIICADQAALDAQLQRLKTEHGWKKVGVHHGDLTDGATQTLGLETLWVDNGYNPHELEKCDVGITLCDALIAQTGSILMTNTSAGGRVLSILPPHHLVLVKRDQLLPDLPAAFALLEEKYGPNYPSLMGFITGPSRTGDIERILVLGAHGPKKLTILLV